MANLRSEQVYDPTATRDNLSVIPTGSGERMEGAYHVYTGLKSENLKGSDSQVIESFAD
ncbi:hypothetical protein [Vibrio paucivorans]